MYIEIPMKFMSHLSYNPSPQPSPYYRIFSYDNSERNYLIFISHASGNIYMYVYLRKRKIIDF